MITGAVKLAKAVWDMAGRALGGFAAWLREPRDWWRFIAAGLAVFCLGQAFAVHNARQQVLVVREQCQTQIVTIQSEAKAAANTAQQNARSLLTCQTQLAAEVGKQQRIQKLADDAVAAAQRDATAARNSMAEWQKQYSNRPATCRAALEALESACPTITDY